MKILITNITSMLVVILLGKRSKRMGAKEYSLIAVLCIVQVLVAVYSMYTMKEPALY